jgi:hypothetical protein
MVEEKQRERAHRLPVMISATLVTPGGQRLAVRIRNFSETGIGLMSDTLLMVGEPVKIELRDSRITGHVVRQYGNIHGIQVTKRIDVTSLAKRPASDDIFVVSKLHRISEKTYRPRIKS